MREFVYNMYSQYYPRPGVSNSFESCPSVDLVANVKASNASKVYAQCMKYLGMEVDLFSQEVELRSKIRTGLRQIKAAVKQQEGKPVFSIQELSSCLEFLSASGSFFKKFSVNGDQRALKDLFNATGQTKYLKLTFRDTTNNIDSVLLIDLSINGFKEHCTRLISHPNQKVSLFFDMVLAHSEHILMRRTDRLFAEVFTQNLRDILGGIHNEACNPTELQKKLTPAMIRFFAFCSASIDIQQDNLSKEILPSLEQIEGGKDQVVNHLKNGYWNNQKFLIQQVWHRCNEQGKRPISEADYRKLIAQCDKLIEAFASQDTLMQKLDAQISLEPLTIPPRVASTNPFEQEALKVLMKSPIKAYSKRVNRWLQSYKNPKEIETAVRKFEDRGGTPYARLSSQAILANWNNHGFSLKVDELLSGRHGSYAYRTDQGYAMIVELNKQLGVISYGINSSGICYHRMFSPKKNTEILKGDFRSLFEYRQKDVSCDVRLKDAVENPESSEDTLSIDFNAGVATVIDKKNKCTIRVLPSIKE